MKTSLRPFRMGWAFAFFNATTWQVALGTPLVLLAESVGATVFEVGLLYSFLFLMTPVQVFSTALLPRFGYKNLMLFGWGTRALCLLVPIYLAWTRPSNPEQWHVNILILSMFLFAFLRSVGNCSFIPWMYSILPEKARGRYFANEQIFSGIAGVGTLIACSVFFFAVPLHDAFLWQYGMAIAGALLSWYALKKIPDGTPPDRIDLKLVLREAPKLCFRRSRYRQFLWSSVLFTICSAPIVPFSIYFLRVEARLEPGQIIIFTTLQYFGAIAGSLFIRNFIDHTGPRVFFRISIALYSAVAFAWRTMLQREEAWGVPLLVVYFLLGMAASAWVSANLNYLPRLTSERERPLRVSVHGAVTAFLGGLSPIVWGLFLRGQDASGAQTMNTNAFQIFFVFVILSQLILLWNVRYFRARKTDTTPIVLAGAMGRPIRSLGTLVDLVTRRNNRGKKPSAEGSD